MPPTTKEKEALLNPFPLKYRIPLIIFHVSQIVLVWVYAILTIVPAFFLAPVALFFEGFIPFYVQFTELLLVGVLSFGLCVLLCVPSLAPRVYIIMYLLNAIVCAVFFFLGGIEYPIALLIFIGDLAYKTPRYSPYYIFAQFFFSCLMTFHLNVMPIFVAIGVRRLLHIRTGVVKV